MSPDPLAMPGAALPAGLPLAAKLAPPNQKSCLRPCEGRSYSLARQVEIWVKYLQDACFHPAVDGTQLFTLEGCELRR